MRDQTHLWLSVYTAPPVGAMWLRLLQTPQRVSCLPTFSEQPLRDQTHLWLSGAEQSKTDQPKVCRVADWLPELLVPEQHFVRVPQWCLPEAEEQHADQQENRGAQGKLSTLFPDETDQFPAQLMLDRSLARNCSRCCGRSYCYCCCRCRCRCH